MKHNQHPLRTHDDTAGEQQRKVSGKMHVQGEIEVHFPPEVTQANAASEEKRSARERIKQRVEVTTLSFVVIVAILNCIQTGLFFKTTQAALDANEATRRNFHIQAAPYIDVLQVLTDHGPEGQERLEFQIKNFGTTPGLNVTAFSRFVFADPDSSPAPFTWDENLAQGSFPLSPGAMDSVILNHILSKDEAAKYHSGQQKAFYGISIWYSDVWGSRKQVVYCKEFRPSNQEWIVRYPDCGTYR